MIHYDRNHPSVNMWSTGNEVREQGNPAGHKISQRLTAIIKKEGSASIADTAGCVNFCRQFKYRAGISPSDYLVELRIGQLKDIARQCGFKETSYFCKVFRKRFGLPPDALPQRPLGQLNNMLLLISLASH